MEPAFFPYSRDVRIKPGRARRRDDMSYLSLYRQWRPQMFEDIVGQEHIVRTLRNAIANSRVVHAYMFSGPRGTGKTSTAKVFAKALNCSEGPTVKPCGKCVSCLAVKEGNALDVIEIDAASNRGIDEIRDLRDKVRFSPAQGRYKVYIIDEVHMLTMEAFNALLKTLEEPPSHAIFILATTESNRVPSTILSRCQRFDFNRLNVTQLSEHLKKVCIEIGASFEADALTLIARKAEGSARDALGLLEQVSGSGDKLTTALISEMLGATGFDRLDEIARAIGEGNPGKLYPLVSDTLASGTDPRQLLAEVGEHFMDMMLAAECPDRLDLLHSGEERFGELAKTSALFPKGRLNSIIKSIGVGLAEIGKAQNPRLIMELFLARLLGQQEAEPEKESHIRPAAEMQMPKRAVRPQQQAGVAPRSAPDEAHPAAPAEAPVRKDASSVKQDDSQVPSERAQKQTDGQRRPQGQEGQRTPEVWLRILEEVRRRSVKVEALARQGRSLMEGDMVVLEYSADWSFHHQKMTEPVNEKVMSEAVKAVLGEDAGFHCRLAADISETAQQHEKAQGSGADVPKAASGRAKPSTAKAGEKPKEPAQPKEKAVDEEAVRRSLEKAKALFSEVEIKLEEDN